MFTGATKIVKPEGQEADEFKKAVAQELFNLEMSAADIEFKIRDLYITGAKQVHVGGGKKAITIFVPYSLLRSYHKIPQRLVGKLEKKSSCRHVVIIATRTILGKSYAHPTKTQGIRQR